jgi:hypothetical protein
MKTPCSYSIMNWRIVLVLLFFVLNSSNGYSQFGNAYKPTNIKYIPVDTSSEYHSADEDYAETYITLNVPGIASLEIPGVVDGQKVFFAEAKTGNDITTTQLAKGSLLYDTKTNYLAATDQNSVGKGGIIVLAYLDINCNGRRDPGEPKVAGLNLCIYGGRMERNDRDTVIQITGLEANTNCFIELDKNGFDDVAWQIAKSTISITIEPNNLKLIEVPVAVVGEVSGTVFLSDSKGTNGLSRIILNIYNKDGVLAGSTITEKDGYFSFMGLVPGNYVARVDEEQLQKIKMKVTAPISFTIRQSIDGDVADSLKFIVTALAK